MSRAVQIRSVLSTWPHVAFTGDVDDGRRLRFVAPKGESMPRTVAVGETGRSKGVSSRTPSTANRCASKAPGWSGRAGA